MLLKLRKNLQQKTSIKLHKKSGQSSMAEDFVRKIKNENSLNPRTVEKGEIFLSLLVLVVLLLITVCNL